MNRLEDRRRSKAGWIGIAGVARKEVAGGEEAIAQRQDQDDARLCVIDESPVAKRLQDVTIDALQWADRRTQPTTMLLDEGRELRGYRHRGRSHRG